MRDINTAIVYINNKAQLLLSVFLQLSPSDPMVYVYPFQMVLLSCSDPCADHTLTAYIVGKRQL